MLLLLVGLLAILTQIVLLRELNVAFYGVELVYAIALAAWMAGNAAGALAVPRLRATAGRVSWLVAAAALLCPVDVAWIRASRVALGATPGAYLAFGQQLFALLVALLPPSLLLGLAFRWAAEEAVAGRQLATARAYAIESAGAVAGALAATAAFAAGTPTFALALAVAGIVPALLSAMQSRRARRAGSGLASRCWLVVSVALASAGVVGAGVSGRPDLAMTSWSHPTAISSRDSPYARITTTRSGSQTALFLDDVLVYESETADNESLAHVVALHHPRPARMLLLGGVIERLDVELLKHRPERLDVVELDPTVALGGALRATQPAIAARHLFVGDPRAFLSRAGRYDVIVAAMPDPVSGLTNRFYTTEFFAECAARLAPGGVVGFRLQLSENVITPALAERTASVVGALRAVFPNVRIFAGERAIAVASMAALPDGPGTLIARLQERAIDGRLVTPAYLRYLFADDRREMLLRQLAGTPAPINSDALPACYRYASVLWLSKFFPSMIGAHPGGLPGLDRLSLIACFATFAVAAAIAVVAIRRRRPWRAAALAGAAGAAGMILETVILLVYQSRTGAVFEHLGLLLTAFMLGLSLGAWRMAGTRRVRTSTLALLGVLLLLALATVFVTRGGVPFALPRALPLLAAVGAVVGALFACALATAPDAGIGALYAADLAGGCVGALGAGLAFIPLVGLAATASLVVVMVALGAAASA